MAMPALYDWSDEKLDAEIHKREERGEPRVKFGVLPFYYSVRDARRRARQPKPEPKPEPTFDGPCFLRGPYR